MVARQAERAERAKRGERPGTGTPKGKKFKDANANFLSQTPERWLKQADTWRARIVLYRKQHLHVMAADAMEQMLTRMPAKKVRPDDLMLAASLCWSAFEKEKAAAFSEEACRCTWHALRTLAILHTLSYSTPFALHEFSLHTFFPHLCLFTLT